SSAIEKRQLNFVFSRYLSKLRFSLIDGPVCHHISSVFRAVGVTQHNHLLAPPGCNMLLVYRMRVKGFHNFWCTYEIINGLKKRNKIDGKLRLFPSCPKK